MTPKEKAIEIYTKMFDQIFAYYATDNLAKGCAILAVDEMLNEYPSQVPKDSYEMERHLYWIEVKKEIEKL
jgi:hypothetical protein